MISLDPGVCTFMTGYDPSRTLLNREKITLVEFTDYVMHMINSKASVTKFMEKKFAKTLQVNLFINYLFI